MKFLVRLFNTGLFLAAWLGSCMALYALMDYLLETRSFPPGQPLPRGFEVVVEFRAAGKAPSYETRPFTGAPLALAPGETLHLGTRTYDQMQHDTSGRCCMAFKVLEDGPQGQLVEVNDNDMSFVMSRYRVRDGKVEPIAHRSHFTLYSFAYFVIGGVFAWLLTRPVRRRTLAWASRRRPVESGPAA